MFVYYNSIMVIEYSLKTEWIEGYIAEQDSARKLQFGTHTLYYYYVVAVNSEGYDSGGWVLS